MTTIIYDSFDKWQGNQTDAYFEVETDSIHVLNKDDAELRRIFHEKTHAERQNKLTFKLASVIANPASNIILLGLVGVSVLMLFVSAIPITILASFYAILNFLHIREETIATSTANRKLREVKQ